MCTFCSFQYFEIQELYHIKYTIRVESALTFQNGQNFFQTQYQLSQIHVAQQLCKQNTQTQCKILPYVN